jgi:hypothetical protein
LRLCHDPPSLTLGSEPVAQDPLAADLWFEKLPKEKMATWELFEVAFLTEFPVVKVVEKTKEQYEEELLELKLKEEELGKSVEKGSRSRHGPMRSCI